jgi:hypothetical protein
MAETNQIERGSELAENKEAEKQGSQNTGAKIKIQGGQI